MGDKKLRGVRSDGFHLFDRFDEMELHGSITKEEWVKIWESCKPKLLSKDKFRQVMIYGTGGPVSDPDNRVLIFNTVF